MSIDEIAKEGELQLIDKRDLEQPIKQIWAKLKGNHLYCYSDKNENENALLLIDLNTYSYILDQRRSTDFKLTSKNKPSITFNATSAGDKNRWIKEIEQYLPKGRATTVRNKNDLESICTVWFIVIFMAMMVLVVLGLAVNDKYYHISSIPLSFYELTIIISCCYYCRKLWHDIECLIKINKFWIQSFCCFMYNIITFLLMVINLSINFKVCNKWYFANSMVYLFGAFSIPFPAICIKLHHKLKPNEWFTRSSIIDDHEVNSPIKSTQNQPKIPQGTYDKRYQQLQEHRNSLLDEVAEESHDELRGELGDGAHGEFQGKSNLETIRKWLNVDIGLPQYYDTFIEHGIINMDMVKTLDNDELKEMDVKIGHRKIMIKHISNMRNVFSSAKSIDDITVSTALAAARPIFRDNILKGLICLCYAAHFLSYIGFPAIRPSSYIEMNNIIYNNQSSIFYIVIYDINQIFLRTFVGMSLTSVFFTFVTELTDKQIAKTDFWILWDIWKDQLNVFWISMSILFVILLPFEILEVRKYFRTYLHIDFWINVIWTVFNVIAVIILIQFLRDFGGIYDKTKYNYKIMWQQVKSPPSPIKAFVLESLLLLCLYLVYIVFLAIHIVVNPQDYINWDMYRQSSILILSVFQFITLIRVKQIQKFGKAYLSSFEKRSTGILHCYYKYMCLVLIYNIAYIFIFKIEYFGSKSIHSDDLFQHISYSFSFSLSALLMFILSHFITSYQQWRYDQDGSKDNADDFSVKPNKNLNIFKAAEKKKRSESVSSLLVNGQ